MRNFILILALILLFVIGFVIMRSIEMCIRDRLTASGSGLDPHISPKAAEVQIETVAKNSGLSEEKVKEIVKSHTEEKFLGIFGEEKVNVLKCNLDIAAAMGII